MHILATTATSLDEIVEPVDLGQTPGDNVGHHPVSVCIPVVVVRNEHLLDPLTMLC